MDVTAPQLETPRLLLRLPRQEDFGAWAAFMADAEATAHIGGVQPRAQAWRGLATVVGAWQLRGYAMFSVVEKATGEWVGRVGPWQPEGWPGAEVGWGIVRSRWGRGYATEAATACLDWVFDVLGWDEVLHVIGPGNERSMRVAARLGSRFLRMGRLPEPLHGQPVELWGQTRAQWRARREQGA
ncbi:MAG: GNAT family N-acetyltransferase [Lysobacteraceae bacterium]|jgi:Acetyltransferases, including N-acetylases of ribosomal proteins|nr:N-acetyltransferase [Xanthomonadaceae bacterium]